MWIRKRIRQLEESIEEINTMLTRTTNTLSDMPRTRSHKDYLNELTAKKIKVEEKLKQLVTKWYIELDEIEDVILRLPTKEQHIFNLRYIQGKKWEDISIDTGYSFRQVQQIHGDALKKYGWV